MTRRGRGRRSPRTAAPKPEVATRTCLGCRGRFPRDELVRWVVGPDGQLFVDRNLKLPGRGAHLCHDAACLEKAIRRKAFGRAFRQPVGAIDGEALRGRILEAVEARVVDLLGIARRAGWTVSGADVLDRALQTGQVGLVVTATDAAENSLKRVNMRCEAERVPVAEGFLDREALGRTQGREALVAVGITHGPVADKLQSELQRRNRVLVAAAAQSL
jgi:predicted RNA-binding protein YlxR (DUF448 family)